MPRAVLPEVFFSFSDKLDELCIACEGKITQDAEDRINSLIERIEVHNNDKSSGHCYVKVDIYFTAVGMIDIPTEQEILAMMEEIRENPQDFRFVA